MDIVFGRISVYSRIRYENDSVDANQSMRFQPFKNAYCTFENALVWTGPQTNLARVGSFTTRKDKNEFVVLSEGLSLES